MIAGLPGTGIGGLFYVLSALWAPLRSAIRRRAGTLKRAMGLAAMAGAVMAAIWATGWGVGELVHRVVSEASARSGGVVLPASNLVHRAALLLALGTLGLVLAAVELFRLVLRVPPVGVANALPFRPKRIRRDKAAA